jgi:hypothetical protein
MPIVIANPVETGYKATVIADSPFSYFRLDEPASPMSDTMIFREGPISGTPTYQTASLISTDLANKSLTLTSSSHVEINDSAFNISGAKSFEFWVNVNDTSVRQAFMGKQNYNQGSRW